MLKQVLFNQLEDGEVFRFKQIWWIRCNESEDYNAVRLNDSRKCCDIGLTAIVEIKTDEI